MNYESQYRNLLINCLQNGVKCDARNDATIALINTTITADCSDGKLPLITTKKVNYQAAIVETLWFMKGYTNLEYLHKHGVHIWDQWADDNGDLGPIYGDQWGRQLDTVLYEAHRQPFSRRLLVNSWQLDDLDIMALPPCHYAFQIVNYYEASELCTDLVVTMRSSDAFIGIPFNLVNYGVLLHIISKELGSHARNLHINSANFHIYSVHREQVKRQLARSYNEDTKRLPELCIDWSKVDTIYELEPEHFYVKNYEHQGFIKAPVLK